MDRPSIGRTVFLVKTRVCSNFPRVQQRPFTGSVVLRKTLTHESFPTEGAKPAFFSPPPWFWVVWTPVMNPVLAVVVNGDRILRTGIVYNIYSKYIFSRMRKIHYMLLSSHFMDSTNTSASSSLRRPFANPNPFRRNFVYAKGFKKYAIYTLYQHHVFILFPKIKWTHTPTQIWTRIYA